MRRGKIWYLLPLRTICIITGPMMCALFHLLALNLIIPEYLKKAPTPSSVSANIVVFFRPGGETESKTTDLICGKCELTVLYAHCLALSLIS